MVRLRMSTVSTKSFVCRLLRDGGLEIDNENAVVGEFGLVSDGLLEHPEVLNVGSLFQEFEDANSLNQVLLRCLKGGLLLGECKVPTSDIIDVVLTFLHSNACRCNKCKATEVAVARVDEKRTTVCYNKLRSLI